LTENVMTGTHTMNLSSGGTPPIAPHYYVDLFGWKVSEPIFMMWVVMLIIILFAVVVRVFLIKRFKTVPRGIQNVLEIIVSAFDKFSKSVLGKHGPTFASYMFTIALVIFTTSLVELVGFRAPATDLNFTVAIAGMSFLLINGFGLYYSGVLGRIKWFFKPKGFLLPINILTHAVIPVSLAFRLFGNMFAGLVVMHLLYDAIYLSFVLPAVVSIYFNIIHVGIQTYIFLVLTMQFMEETVAYGEKQRKPKRKALKAKN